MSNAASLSAVRCLLLPGWQGSGPAHWQSAWRLQHGCELVDQADWEWPRRGDWMAQLDETVQRTTVPVVLIGHSLGCHLVDAWAGHSQHTGRVRGALLVAPPDLDRDKVPPQLAAWRPRLAAALPFASTVVLSTDDPFCPPERAAAMAATWGSATMALDACGHINAESGLGDWPEGWAIVQALAGDRGQSSAW